MNFIRAETSAHYRTLCLRSAEGRWEIGLMEYATGMRIRMGRRGMPPSVLDFCVGTDPRLLVPVFAAVLSRLAAVPEEGSDHEIDDLFPWRGGRPDLALHLDELLRGSPDCRLPVAERFVDMKTSTQDKIEGAAKEVGGKIQEKLGRATKDYEMQDRGAAQEAEGKIQSKVGDVKKVFNR